MVALKKEFAEVNEMKKIKLIDSFGHAGEKNNRIYVIKDGVEPIYVGKAGKQQVGARVLHHIIDVFTDKKPSLISHYLFKAHPRYLDFDIDIYTSEEVTELTKCKSSCLACAEKEMYKLLLSRDIELKCNAIPPRDKCTCSESH